MAIGYTFQGVFVYQLNTTGNDNIAIGSSALIAADRTDNMFSGLDVLYPSNDTIFSTTEFISILTNLRGSGEKIKGSGELLHIDGRAARLLGGNVVAHADTWFDFSKTVSLRKEHILTTLPALFKCTLPIKYRGKKQNFDSNFLETNCSVSVQSYSHNDNMITLNYRIAVEKNSLLIKLPVEFYNERTVGLRHATF